MNMTSRAPLFAALLVTASLWAWGFWHSELGWLTAPVLIAWLAARRHCPRRALGAVVCLSPLVTVPAKIVASTAASYARGNATLARGPGGLPGPESRNLDRSYRVFPSGGSCTIDVSGALLADLGNATLIALIRTMGPMKGSYLGPYPTAGEADAILTESGVELDSDGWDLGELALDGQLFPVTSRWRDRVGGGAVRRILAARRADLVIVLVETESNRYVSLVDLRSAGWFATYRSPR